MYGIAEWLSAIVTRLIPGSVYVAPVITPPTVIAEGGMSPKNTKPYNIRGYPRPVTNV